MSALSLFPGTVLLAQTMPSASASDWPERTRGVLYHKLSLSSRNSAKVSAILSPAVRVPMQTGTRTTGAFGKRFWDLGFIPMLAKLASTGQQHCLRQQHGKGGSTAQSVGPT